MLITHALRELRGAVRAAKRAFFDGIIERTHPSRIWDLVQWTKPRPDAAFATLRDPDGNPATSADAIFRTFQEQFYPARAAPVDLSIIDEFPQMAVREFPPISQFEIFEHVADTSNFSAPGPDHCGWFF
ncbi:hypothetical protein CERSUDRAFT_58099, partial [Gelatoporia subvermispora B]